MGSFVGLDLAWQPRHRTGLAVVDDTGRLVASGVARADDEVAAWIEAHAPRPVVVAIDAPLVVPNATGQRRCENLIGRAFGRYGASAHVANRSRPWFDPPRAATLAQRLGWSPDPALRGSVARPVALEVYPHPALVGLFVLPERILYKKGPDRQAGFRLLLDCLAGVPELRLDDSERWHELDAIVRQPARGDLTRIEDELDGILCAHLAWLWHHRPDALQVYGSLEEGYIVAPPPPTHPSGLRRSGGGRRVRS